MQALGIDIGGSGMKGAIVDTATGVFLTDRYRVKTPQPATPEAMAEVFNGIVKHHNWQGPIGCAMPGPIKSGKVLTANNIHRSWIGVEAAELFGLACGRHVTVINDADAAGLAEIRFGAGKDKKGVVVIITLGTGIGSALFVDGKLVPNTELGQVDVRGKNAERRASARIRKEKGWSWERWAKAVAEYLHIVEQIIWPDLIIIGGGVSKSAGKFLPYIKSRAVILPAQLRNDAGIIGAALCAA